jgi:hypothetical protein
VRGVYSVKKIITNAAMLNKRIVGIEASRLGGDDLAPIETVADRVDFASARATAPGQVFL